MRANTILHVEVPVTRNELAGEPTGDYERTGRREWFEIIPIGGGEYVQGRQSESSITHVLRCHYFAGANSLMRLTAGESATPSRIFSVDSVVNVNEENRFLEWSAIEKT